MRALVFLVSFILLSDTATSSEVVEKLAVKDFAKPEQLVEFVNKNYIAIVRIESFANRRFKFQRLWYEPLKLKTGIGSDSEYAAASAYIEETYEK